MTAAATESDNLRWSAVFGKAREPVFVINQRRKVIFANRALSIAAGVSVDDLHSLTLTNRATSHALNSLAQALAPPDGVFSGAAATVRRPMPGRDRGPPWWDIDFVPLMDDGVAIAVIGRIHAPAPLPIQPATPNNPAWAELRMRVQHSYSMTMWDSAIPAIRRMVGQARLVATTGCPAALVGEPGTGKHSLARAIHAASARKELPFVALNCDRLPADVVQAVLDSPPQLFGMVYLHAPALLPRDLQSRLAARVVGQTQVLLGCPTEPASDLRDGRLSEDLWVAASTVVIAFAPLRLRLADLPRIADRLLNRIAVQAGRETKSLAPAAMELLSAYAWPGNLDELAELLRTATTRSENMTIDAGDLPLALREPQEGSDRSKPMPPLDQLLEQVESRMIHLALNRAGGNKTKAAELLGIWRPRLIRRMEALGIADTGD